MTARAPLLKLLLLIAVAKEVFKCGPFEVEYTFADAKEIAPKARFLNVGSRTNNYKACLPHNASFKSLASTRCVQYGNCVRESNETGICVDSFACTGTNYSNEKCECVLTPGECHCPETATHCMESTFTSDDIPSCVRDLLERAPLLLSETLEPCFISTQNMNFDELVKIDKKYALCYPEPYEINVFEVGFRDSYHFKIHGGITTERPSDKRRITNYVCANSTLNPPALESQIARTGDETFLKNLKSSDKPNQACVKNQTLDRKFALFEGCEIPYTYTIDRVYNVWRFGKVVEGDGGYEAVPKCEACQTICKESGMEIQYDSDSYEYTRICSGPYCVSSDEIPESEKTSSSIRFVFPTEVLTKKGKIEYKVSVWAKGLEVYNVVRFCDSVDLCSTIGCFFCKDNFYNYQCMGISTTWAVVIFSVLTIVFIGILIKFAYALISTFWGLVVLSGYYLLYYLVVLPVFKCCGRFERRKTKMRYNLDNVEVVPTTRASKNGTPKNRVRVMFPADEERRRARYYPNRGEQDDAISLEEAAFLEGPTRPRRNYLSTPKCIILISFALFCCGECCVETSISTATGDVCERDAKGMNCTLTSVSHLAVSPRGTDICLLMQSTDRNFLASLSITIDAIRIVCVPRIKYYTKSHSFSTVAAQRCWGNAECITGEDGKYVCDNWDPSEDAQSISKIYHGVLGKSYCMRNCQGGVATCWCASTGCLFWKNFIESESKEVFKVVSCPEWQYSIKAVFKLTKASGKQVEETTELTPGVVIHLNKIHGLRVTLSSITTPPAPVIAKDFIVNDANNRGAVVEGIQEGIAVRNTLSSLQCPTRQAAAELNPHECFIPEVPCDCNPGNNNIQCVCPHVIIENLITKDRKLPMYLKNGVIQIINNGRIAMDVTKSTGLTLEVATNGMKLSTTTTKSKCTVRQLSLDGCYSCMTGAKFFYTCKTDFGDAIGRVACDNGVDFSVRCNSDSFKSSQILKFDASSVQMKCDVICTGGVTSFDMKGKLNFVYNRRVFNYTMSLISQYVGDDTANGISNFFGSSWGGMMEFMLGNWKTVIISCVIGLVVFIFAYFFVSAFVAYMFKNYTTKVAAAVAKSV